MIKLNTVSMRYPGGITALHETILNFKKGQFTVLIGSSGAGKSTLLRCINMLNRPTTGSVEIEGLGKLNDKHLILQKHRQNTAMVFQQHQLIGRHTALQNVLVGRIGKFSSLRSLFPFPEQDKMIALECLKRVELLYKANERVDRLSGGQQQRVGIARGLAQQPHIMLADEPVASLDPATSHKVLSLLYDICREDNLTAIVSLHQVELAKEFGDRVIGLAGGRVVFDGHPEELSDDILGVIYHKTYIHESVFKQRDGKADGSERTYEVAASSI